MKPLMTITTFAILLTGCQALAPVDPNVLDGTWKLVETLADPGDGSGVYEPAPNRWELEISGTEIFVKEDLCDAGLGNESGTINVTDGLVTLAACPNEQLGTDRVYYYELKDDRLILSDAGCIEACGLKFKKVSEGTPSFFN